MRIESKDAKLRRKDYNFRVKLNLLLKEHEPDFLECIVLAQVADRGLWVIRLCQCQISACNKLTTQAQDVDRLCVPARLVDCELHSVVTYMKCSPTMASTH